MPMNDIEEDLKQGEFSVGVDAVLAHALPESGIQYKVSSLVSNDQHQDFARC